MTARLVAQMADSEPRFQTPLFKVTSLSLALTLLSAAMAMPAYALEAIDESVLSDATAEGIAFLPENAALVFRSAGITRNASGGMVDAFGTLSETVANILTDRTLDTGYIRYVPVGPLTAAAIADPIFGLKTGKADLFLYGLAISKGNGDSNNRLSSTAPQIVSWGTAVNPWLLSVNTQTGVQNFANTGTGDVSYLSLEAPLYNLTKPTASDKGLDAYNLKVAFWADAFVRDPSKAENMGATGTQFDVGGSGRANRLRLQAVMDGVSINGTRIQAFQTLGGAASTSTIGATDTFYNNTLGLAGLLRINSGDTQASNNFKFDKSTTTAGKVSRSTTVTNRYSTQYTGVPGSGTVASDRLYRLRSNDTVDTLTSATWALPTNLPVVRFSTQECGTGSLSGCTGTPDGLLATPAIGTAIGKAPTFDSEEGLFLYGLNANLVLGNLAQPLIVGKENVAGSKNLVLELTRIPNKPELYKQIYTAYAGAGSAANGVLSSTEIADYKGSTCNAYQCGTPIQVNGTNTYQGNTATHSSISIGSTVYDSVNNLLTAYNGDDAIGVMFGKTPQGAVTQNAYYTLEYQARRRSGSNNNLWEYATSNAGTTITYGALGTASCGANCYEFDTKAAWLPVTTALGGFFRVTGLQASYMPNTAHATYTMGSFVNPAWGPLLLSANSPLGNNVAPTAAQKLNPGAIIGSAGGTLNTWYENTVPTLGSVAVPTNKVAPMNNLGSAVIDGLLIQHLKFTTQGL